MPSITARAASRLIEDRKRRGLADTYEPRLSRKGGKIVLGFAVEPAAEDLVAAGRGIRLFVAPDVTDDLNNAVVDLQKRDDGERLMLLKPRAKVG